MNRWIERHWYDSKLTWLTAFFLPLAWLFRFIAWLRKKCYQRVSSKKNYPAPIIIVGNLTLGGTGKTPIVIWLANLLQKEGFKPGIVSRGVGGKGFSSPHRVIAKDTVDVIGDEAKLIYDKTQAPVVLCKKRCKAVEELLAKTDCNIVIADDGLQHYALPRDIEIAVIDGVRRLGNEQLLPAGPLREPKKRLNETDFVLTNTSIPGYFNFSLAPKKIFNLLNPTTTVDFKNFRTPVYAIAGIGHPHRFFNLLESHDLKIIPNVFNDHHPYTQADFCGKLDLPMIMTEKDAVKCKRFARDNWWVLQVEPQFNESFIQDLLKKIRRCHVEKNEFRSHLSC